MKPGKIDITLRDETKSFLAKLGWGCETGATDNCLTVSGRGNQMGRVVKMEFLNGRVLIEVEGYVQPEGQELSTYGPIRVLAHVAPGHLASLIVMCLMMGFSELSKATDANPAESLLAAARAPFLLSGRCASTQLTAVCEQEFVVSTSRSKFLVGLAKCELVPDGPPLGDGIMPPLDLDDEWDVLHMILSGLSNSKLAQQVTGLKKHFQGDTCYAYFRYAGDNYVFKVANETE